jgi:xanthine/CO dehydrogenase XdhC/CoxF family maturation factor
MRSRPRNALPGCCAIAVCASTDRRSAAGRSATASTRSVLSGVRDRHALPARGRSGRGLAASRYLAAEAQAGRIDARTVVTVLTHDPRFDVPVLEVALRLPALGYVGAMDSG